MPKTKASIQLCSACGARPGKFHNGCCDVERCPVCGHQAISCGCGVEAQDKAGRIPWDGEWPGVRECKEFGWFVTVDPQTARIGGRCGSDHPHAFPDLNRLAVEAVWDNEKRKYVPRA